MRKGQGTQNAFSVFFPDNYRLSNSKKRSIFRNFPPPVEKKPQIRIP